MASLYLVDNKAMKNAVGPFDLAKQQFWEWLTDDSVFKVGIVIVDGFGKASLRRQLMEAAEGWGLFDKIAWVRFKPGESLNQIDGQRKVAEGLGIQVQTYELQRQLSWRIISFLESRRFMLILDGLNNGFDLEEVGLPREGGNKVVIMAGEPRVCSEMAVEREMTVEWEKMSVGETMNLLCQEAMDMANLPSFKGQVTRDVILECFFYCCLFPEGMDYSLRTLSRYWTSEGFLSGFGNPRSGALALHSELTARCMLSVTSEGQLTIPSPIRSKVVSITEGQGTYPRRFLVRCDLGLAKAPEVGEWEDVERVSLVSNQIESIRLSEEAPVLPKLCTLLLTDNPLQHISDSFFQNMRNLRVLSLANTLIASFPSSVSCLCNLRMLNLKNCRNLQALPQLLWKALNKLEVLDLYKTPIKNISSSAFENMFSLHYLDISGAKELDKLSVRGCRSLETLNGLSKLKNLEVLDLSGTSIKEFPHIVTKLTSLIRMDLFDTKNLAVVDWQKIDWLPKVLNWNQCGFDLPREQFRGNHGYYISVTDASIFLTLSPESQLWDKCFQKFHFSISPCEEQGKDRYNPFQEDQFLYRDIFVQTQPSSISRSYVKTLKIHGGNGVPFGIKGVLYNTEFLSLHRNGFIKTLSSLGLKNLGKLQECQIDKCHKMESLIVGESKNTQVCACLEYLLVFDLRNLTTICKGLFGQCSFVRLNNIYLEGCPRLRNLFSSTIRFENLEKLEIRFCGRLENVFQGDEEGQSMFPFLHTLCLWALPKLKNICGGYLPALKKLKVGRCPRLLKLPLRAGDPDSPTEISGEPDWWNNVTWEDYGIKQHLHFQEQDPLVSNVRLI